MTVFCPESTLKGPSTLPANEASSTANIVVAQRVTRLLMATPEFTENGVTVSLNGSTASGTALPGSSDVDLWLTFPVVPESVADNHGLWLSRRECAIRALSRIFRPDAIEERQKCLYVPAESSDGVDLDFTVAQELSPGASDEKEFWTLSGNRITTSPSLALRNIERIDAKTNGAYRAAVILLKTAKRDLITSNEIDRNIAPGFHLLAVANALSQRELAHSQRELLIRAAERIIEILSIGSNLLTIVGTHHVTFGHGPTEWNPNDALKFAEALKEYSLPDKAIIVA